MLDINSKKKYIITRDLPDIFWNVFTKAIPDAFYDSLVVPGLLKLKGTKDVSMFVQSQFGTLSAHQPPRWIWK